MSAVMQVAASERSPYTGVAPAAGCELLVPSWGAVLLAGDAFGVALAAWLAHAPAFAWALLVVVPLVFAASKSYRRSLAQSWRDEAYFAAAGVGIAFVPLALVAGIVPMLRGALPGLVGAAAIALVLVALLRAAWFALRAEGTRIVVLPPAPVSALRPSPAAQLVRRTFDIVVTVVALVVLAPLMLLIAVAIWIDDGAPAIFRQQRVGRSGAPFEMFKFRTMRRGAGSAWAVAGDERVTRLGKFLRRTSLDELPQLANVLRGEMSIAGPRPEMPDYAAEFSQRVPGYADRHLVTPGITGWAQVCCTRELTPADIPVVAAYDLAYVRNWSLVLDVAIVIKTAAEAVFRGVA